jgi:hypothetical protein
VDAAGRIIVAESIPIRPAPHSPPNKFDWQIAWLDVETGKTREVAKIDSLTRGQPFFGPWISHQGRMMALVAAENPRHPDLRDIVRLDAAGAAKAPQAHSIPNIWLSGLPSDAMRWMKTTLAFAK